MTKRDESVCRLCKKQLPYGFSTLHDPQTCQITVLSALHNVLPRHRQSYSHSGFHTL